MDYHKATACCWGSVCMLVSISVVLHSTYLLCVSLTLNFNATVFVCCVQNLLLLMVCVSSWLWREGQLESGTKATSCSQWWTLDFHSSWQNFICYISITHWCNLRVWLKRWTVCDWNVKNKICQLPESPRFVVEYRSTQWHVTQRPSSCVGKPCYVLPEKFLHGLNSKLFRMCNRWLHYVVYTCMTSYYISIHEYSSSSFM